jgi:hypothetical protein
VKAAGNPWMKFYPSDWRADPALRSCTVAARGLWIEMLCIMHEATPYGSLLIKGKRIDKKLLASLAGVPEKECIVLMLELEGFGVFDRDEDGTIYSRRMRRDNAKAEEGRKQIAKRWDAENNDRSPNRSPIPETAPEPNTQKPEAKKDSAASAAGAEAPIDHRKRLFSEGLSKLSTMTGKGPDACRSFVGKCLKAASDDAVTVLGLIEDAERNQVIDPSAWIAARLKPTDIGHGKPKSAIIQAADDLCRTIAGFDGPSRGADELRGVARQATPRLLSNG